MSLDVEPKWGSVSEEITKLLPSLTVEVLGKLMKHLEELGVETTDDLSLVSEVDLQGILRPIQTRKLMKHFSKTPENSQVGIPLFPSPTPSTTSSSCSSAGSLTSPRSPQLIVFSNNRDPNWPQNVKIPWDQVPEIQFSLKNNKRLEPDLRRRLIRMLVDDVRKITLHPYKRQFAVLARRMVGLYPKSLEDNIDGEVIGSGYDSLVMQMISRNENLNRPKATKRKPEASESVSSGSEAKQLRDSYGCINSNPDVNPEDIEQLETTKEELKEIYKQNPVLWDNEDVELKMITTFCLQRRDINEGNSITDILKEWPFLREAQGILHHFELLVGIDAVASIREGFQSKGVRLQRYFKSELNCLVEPLIQEAHQQSERDNVKAWIPANFLCMMKCFKEKESSLFLLVDATSTVEEVEKENTDSWPRLVMLGESLLSADNFMVIVDHSVITRGMTSFLTAVAVLFSVYYVFNIQYQSGAGATLEFIQRCFLRINPDKGCKTDKKRKSTCVNPKVLKMINSIAGFEWAPSSVDEK